MRAAFAALLLLTLATPLALAEPTVEHHVDDDGCSSEGFRVVANANRQVGAGFTAMGHCALVLVTS